MAAVSSNELRKGVIFSHEGQSYVVFGYEHIKKGRGLAVIRVKVKNLETGSNTEKTFTNSEKLELIDSERKSAQYLYSDEKDAFFMDNADYTQFSFPLSDIEWEMNFLKEGTKVVVLYLSGKPVTLEIPKSVDLSIVSTQEAVKGDTNSGALKEAILETSFKIMVPLFLKNGDTIKLNTETGLYTSRS